MTLIELLIVLALLGGLATLALTGVGEMSARNRVDITRQRLDLIRQALVGDGVTPGRFLSDLGRLPRVTTAAEGEELAELLADTTGVGVLADSPWPTYTPTIDDGGSNSVAFSPMDIPAHYGWRGPYASLARGRLYDGFGNRFQLKTDHDPGWHEADADDVANHARITAIRSLGQDGQPGGLGWADAEVEVDGLENLATAELTIRVLIRNLADLANPQWTAPAFPAGPDIRSAAPLAAGTYQAGELYVQANGRVFRCKGGTLGATGTPNIAWTAVSVLGQEVIVEDGTQTVAWQYLGDRHESVTCVEAVAFEPDSSATPMGVREVPASLYPGKPTVTLTGLTPGLRWFIVYGGLVAGSSPTLSANGHSSGLQAIELKPGANFITVYLTEKLN